MTLPDPRTTRGDEDRRYRTRVGPREGRHLHAVVQGATMTQASSGGPLAAAERLARRRQDVLAAWRARVVRAIPDGVGDLVDGLPRFLDQLVEALSTRRSDADTLLTTSEAHGVPRTTLVGRSLDEVLTKYRVLREVILAALEADGPLPGFERDVVVSAIDQGMVEAGARFATRKEEREGEAELRLRAVVDALTDHAILRTDPAGTVVGWSAGAERVFGWRRAEIVGRSARILFTPEDVARHVEVVEMQTAATAGRAEDTRWHLRKDGSRFFASGVMNPLRDRAGQVRGYVKVLRDETQRREAEIALAEANRRLGLITDASATLISHVDDREVFTFVNAACARVLRRPRSEVVGRSVREVFGEEGYRALEPWVRRALAGEAVTFDWVSPDGRTHQATYTPDRHADDAVSGFVANVTDVHEHKLATAALDLERHKLEALFQESPAAMALWKGERFVFEKVNAEYQAIFPGRRLVGRPLLEALPELAGQPFPALVARVFETGEPYVGRAELVRLQRSPDGPLEDVYYDFSYVRVLDPEGRPYGVYDHAIDVTDRVLAERAEAEGSARILDALHDLERERDLRERFVATLSHDLRTPLQAAKTSAEVMLLRLGDAAVVGASARRICRTLDRADHMIRDLLDASRVRAGQTLPLDLAELDLRRLVDDTIEELATMHGDRFVVHAPEAVVGHWSAVGVRRILENLVSNAIKYGPAHRPVTVTVREGEDEVALDVHDEGTIPADDVASLFEPFRRAERAQAGEQKGWGLGLTLVRGIAEAHGGRVDVTSAPGAGTTFTVKLPRDARRWTTATVGGGPRA